MRMISSSVSYAYLRMVLILTCLVPSVKGEMKGREVSKLALGFLDF
jgi:hypothetical protein